ncbi:MAG: GspH/FimT family pseudopilin [Pontibacterium sp.]
MNNPYRIERRAVWCCTPFAGFTLIELLVCLSCVAILCLIAIPDMSDWLRKNKVEATSHYLKSHLALMRTEAINRSAPIALCRATSDSLCAGHGLRGKRQWQQALLFEDTNNNRLWESSTEPLIRVLAFDASVRVVWNRGDLIRYQASGYLNPSTLGSFYVFSDHDLSEGKRLVAQMTGRVRTASLSSSDQGSLSAWLAEGG